MGKLKEKAKSIAINGGRLFCFGLSLCLVSLGMAVMLKPLLKPCCTSYKEAERIEKERIEFCWSSVKPKHSKEDIESIVDSIKNPHEAFNAIKQGILFKRDVWERDGWYKGRYNGKTGCKELKRWYSLRELMSVGKGDCEDGAIAFAALLSDNPQYEAKIVLLRPKEGSKRHFIAAFRENGRWGYASFNDYRGERNAYLEPAKYVSLDSMIQGDAEMQRFSSYAIINLLPEEMKFGERIFEYEELSKLPITKFQDIMQRRKQ